MLNMCNIPNTNARLDRKCVVQLNLRYKSIKRYLRKLTLLEQQRENTLTAKIRWDSNFASDYNKVLKSCFNSERKAKEPKSMMISESRVQAKGLSQRTIKKDEVNTVSQARAR